MEFLLVFKYLLFFFYQFLETNQSSGPGNWIFNIIILKDEHAYKSLYSHKVLDFGNSESHFLGDFIFDGEHFFIKIFHGKENVEDTNNDGSIHESISIKTRITIAVLKGLRED